MIQTQNLKNRWLRTFSDEGFYISPVDSPEILYADAIDPLDSGRDYVETDELIPVEEDDYYDES